MASWNCKRTFCRCRHKREHGCCTGGFHCEKHYNNCHVKCRSTTRLPPL